MKFKMYLEKKNKVSHFGGLLLAEYNLQWEHTIPPTTLHWIKRDHQQVDGIYKKTMVSVIDQPHPLCLN